MFHIIAAGDFYLLMFAKEITTAKRNAHAASGGLIINHDLVSAVGSDQVITGYPGLDISGGSFDSRQIPALKRYGKIGTVSFTIYF